MTGTIYSLRAAAPADAEAIAAIHGERYGGDPAETAAKIRGEVAAIAARMRTDRITLVAEVGGRVVAYAKAGRLEPSVADGARNAPAGWYLTGIVVAPAFRRRGIGLALTERRLELLADRGIAEVRFFTNAANAASISLHERLGFVEVTRDFAVPGVEFRGGVGVLFMREP